VFHKKKSNTYIVYTS